MTLPIEPFLTINNLESTISIQAPLPLIEDKNGNNLFPVFLKLENLSLLIIGGGNVAFEKLNAVLNNSPRTKIKLVGIEINNAIRNISEQFENLELLERAYTTADIEEADIVIAAVNDFTTSEQIKNDSKEKGKLVNVADKPGLCDFYLGSIVKKGSVKIAISTNGKSPTIAKRLKEVINDLIPEEMENVLQNMRLIRAGMNGDFDKKVKDLNDITKVLVAKQATLNKESKPGTKKWQKIVTWCLLAFFFMILGHTILSFIPLESIVSGVKKVTSIVDRKSFLMMLLCGFLAQMADGSMGMGYGTISTTFLLANGVNPAIVSSRVHSARVFSSGVSGYSHHRFGNFNKKLFKALVIPGVVGAIIGATFAFYAQKYSNYVRIPVSIYTVYLGFFIIRKAFKKQNVQDKVKNAGWLASAGGFLDAFAGGGWGSLVTSTLISKRKSPRYVVGSVCLAEFFVVLASSITFFIFLKSIPLFDVAGLIIGGLIAAPIAARFVGKVPLKTMFILVGSLVIITSFSTIWRVIAPFLR
ncbi:MAG: TSUP family transporter [Ginsengibacter sp.]